VIAREPLPWLVYEYIRIERYAYHEFLGQLSAVEHGVTRALAAAFGERPPPLPTWDEHTEVKAEPDTYEEPAWWETFRQANPDKVRH
jgi:hypothetical protein